MGGGGNLVKPAAAKSALFALCLTLLLSSPATAHASPFGTCNPCDQVASNPCDGLDRCSPKAGQWFLNGHLEAGFFANAHGQKSTYGELDVEFDGVFGPPRAANFCSGNTELLQNTRLTGGQVNQVYLSMGKAVDGRRGLDIGGTIDFTWGVDAYKVQSDGLEINAKNPTGWGTGDYYAAFAQAYAEVEWGKWNVIAGKFYAPFGSSSYKSTDNFFYTWAPTKTIAPTTGTGAYATYSVNKDFALIGGWAMADSVGRYEGYRCDVGLGGISWKAGNRLSLLYTFAVGEMTEKGSDDFTELFVHTFLANYQISKKLKYTFDWTLLNANTHDREEETSFYVTAWGLNNELVYQYNKKWAFGARFGVLCHDILDADWYNVSLGANWTPNKWLTVKPEVRYDWAHGPYKNAFDPDSNGLGTKSHQFSGGLSAVVKF